MKYFKKSRIEALDALRGISALIVVFGHYTYVSSHLYYPGIFKDSLFNFSKQELGVLSFFVLSGFVIFMSLEKVRGAKEFMIKRFIRLYPTFWLCLLLTTFFSFFQPNVHLRVNSLLQFVANLTMFPVMIPDVYGAKFIDGSYWSLCPELFFYFFMATWLFFQKLNKIKIIGCIWVFLSFIVFVLGINGSKIDVVSLRFSSLFFSGIIFYLMWKHKRERAKKMNYIILIINFILANIMLLGDWIDRVFLAVVFIVFFMQSRSLLPKAPSFLLFLGKISYPWYLLHQSIGYLILYWMYALSGPYSQIWVIIPMLITGGMAYLVVEGFERRMLPFLNKKLLENKRS